MTYVKNAAQQSRRQANDNNTQSSNNSWDQVQFPIYILIATRKDYYRKPDTKDLAKDKHSGGIGMWNYFCKCGSYARSQPSVEDSFFVGDAAGRRSDYKQRDSDLKFAERIGLRFYNETDFWMKNQVALYTGVEQNANGSAKTDATTRQQRKRPDIVWEKRKDTVHVKEEHRREKVPLVLILHGLPGSGKSTFAKKFKCNDNRY